MLIGKTNSTNSYTKDVGDDSGSSDEYEDESHCSSEGAVEHAWPKALTNAVNSQAAERSINRIHWCYNLVDSANHRVSMACKSASRCMHHAVDEAMYGAGVKRRPRVPPPQIEYKLHDGEVIQRTGHGIGAGNIDEFYYIEKTKIGEGSSGCIFRATNRATFWTRAVKVLSTKREQDVESFLHEIHVLKALDHPNIVKLFDTYEDDRFIYVVMEYCAGPELAHRIESEGKFTERQTAVMMQQILRALCYMHGSNFMHRDLKPENIMLLTDGPVETNIVKLIDFGLATEIEDGQWLSEKCGSAYYVSPQILSGRYDKKADMWTAGVLMYTLLAGYPPFMGSCDMEILGEVRLGNFFFNVTDWRGIGDTCKDLVRQLIRIDCDRRLTAEQALAHEWIGEWVPKIERVPLQNTIMRSLQEFSHFNFLKKEAMEVVSNHLTDVQLEAQRDSFNALDYEGDGTLGLEEFRDGLLRSGLKSLPDNLEEILESLDSDGSGRIEYTEFLAATVDRKYLDEEVIWSAFRFFDSNGDGKISQKEVFQVINGRIEDPKDYVTIEDVLKLFQQIDDSDDGFIDFSEFYRMMRHREPALKEKYPTLTQPADRTTGVFNKFDKQELALLVEDSEDEADKKRS